MERGALPAGLAPRGFQEGALARFDASNLYEKIDGRADFFLSRGFRSLTALTLSKTGTPATLVDVELYDLGSPGNASSVFTGEKPPDVTAARRAGTASYIARNALFVARGNFYVRAIGSDEGSDVKGALEALRERFATSLPAGEKPFGEELFGSLGIAPDRVSFHEENAFSFGFAKGVHAALLPDGDTELFVMPAADAAAAKSLAERFEKGFLDYGEKTAVGQATWIKDRYLGSFARVVAEGTLVVGVRGAPAVAPAEEKLAGLRKAVAALSPEAVRRASAPGGPTPERASDAAPEKDPNAPGGDAP